MTGHLNSFTGGNSMKKIVLLLCVGLLFSGCLREKDVPEEMTNKATSEAGTQGTKASVSPSVEPGIKYNHLVTLTNFTIFESGKYSLLMTKEMAAELNISEEEYESYLSQLLTM